MRNRGKLAWLLAAFFLPAPAWGVDIKNFRPCYAPHYLGASRTSNKLVPGDFFFATYDIDKLKIDPKTGKANFVVVTEIFDGNANRLGQPREVRDEPVLHLGGNRLPGVIETEMGPNLKPGKYYVRLTVQDRLAEKDAKDRQVSKTHEIELLPKSFGIGGVVAPAVGFAGLLHSTEFVLFYLPLDANKQPSAEVTISVLDVNNKSVVPPVVVEYPRDLPVGVDLVKENFVPVRYPMFLNRPGRFTIDIYAKDKLEKKETRLSYTLTVLDLAGSKQSTEFHNMHLLDERIAQFRKMANDDPDNELGHYRLGQLLQEAGKLEEAVASFRRTLELSPQFSKVYQLLGSCLIQLNHRVDAIKVLREGFAIADERGDYVPRDEISKLLVQLGEPAPVAKQPTAGSGPAATGDGFHCHRPGCFMGDRAKQLAKPPMPDETGQKIYENVCAECWNYWLRDLSIKVINEMRLDLSTQQGADIYDQIMRETLGLT